MRIKGQELVESKQYYDSLKFIFGSRKNHNTIIQSYSMVAIQETLERILAVLEDKQYKTKQVERRSRETPEATTARVDAESVLYKRLQEEKVQDETVAKEAKPAAADESLVEDYSPLLDTDETEKFDPKVEEDTIIEETEKPKLRKRVKI